MTVRELPVANMDKRRDGSAQVQQGMQLDGARGAAEPRPAEQAQAQGDRGGVQRIDGRIQIRRQRLAGIQSPGAHNQLLGQRGVDAPVAMRVGIGQRAAPYHTVKPEMVEAFRPGAQAIHDVAQALAPGQLRIGHAEKLVPARELLNLVVAGELPHTPLELLRMNQRHQLSENGLSCVHPASLAAEASSREPQDQLQIAHNPFSLQHAFPDMIGNHKRSNIRTVVILKIF